MTAPRAPMARPWTTVRRERRRVRAIAFLRFAAAVLIVAATFYLLIVAGLLTAAGYPPVNPSW